MVSRQSAQHRRAEVGVVRAETALGRVQSWRWGWSGAFHAVVRVLRLSGWSRCSSKAGVSVVAVLPAAVVLLMK